MYYQVVAKELASPADWEYYPYWAPGNDLKAAERLAHYAAQSGYEAAILQAEQIGLLEELARGVIDRHELGSLPTLRYQPGTKISHGNGRQEHEVQKVFRLAIPPTPYEEGQDKSKLDQRRQDMEHGPGGDVIMKAEERIKQFSLPIQMDVVSAWLRLRERTELGSVGGATDGTPEDTINERDAS